MCRTRRKTVEPSGKFTFHPEKKSLVGSQTSKVTTIHFVNNSGYYRRITVTLNIYGNFKSDSSSPGPLSLTMKTFSSSTPKKLLWVIRDSSPLRLTQVQGWTWVTYVSQETRGIQRQRDPYHPHKFLLITETCNVSVSTVLI